MSKLTISAPIFTACQRITKSWRSENKKLNIFVIFFEFVLNKKSSKNFSNVDVYCVCNAQHASMHLTRSGWQVNCISLKVFHLLVVEHEYILLNNLPHWRLSLIKPAPFSLFNYTARSYSMKPRVGSHHLTQQWLIHVRRDACILRIQGKFECQFDMYCSWKKKRL